MTTQKKFMGKIRDNPLIALERGSREVMASLWREYLAEALQVNPKAGSFQLLVDRIEISADFPKLYEDWNDLDTPERATRWRELITVAKEQVELAKDQCLRCGECCELGSPTLMPDDISLFQENILDWTDVYVLRRGEKVYAPRSEEAQTLTEERIKIREHSGTKNCLFYARNPNRCLIYNQRPQQCREQLCWAGDEEGDAAVRNYLNRKHLFGGHPEIWELIQAHEQRCASDKFKDILLRLDQEQESAQETLFDMLHFDHYLRQMFLQEWEIPPAAIELLLGRPLSELILNFGLKAVMTPEGVFNLEPRR
jgi:Fe-S-cluster containining protein